MTEKDAAPARRELRDFGLLLGAIFAGLFGVALPLIKHRPFQLWPWIALVLLSAPALFWPPALRPLHFVWIRLGHVLGWINQRIVLTVLFYAVLMPTGLIMRVMGRDPMARRFDRETPTYRVESRQASARSMEHPF